MPRRISRTLSARKSARPMLSVALDDPVPSLREAADDGARLELDAPYRLEREVQQRLLSHPELHFSSLVVRRLGNGVCLEGVVAADDEAPDVSLLARQVPGVESVLNRLLVRTCDALSDLG